MFYRASDIAISTDDWISLNASQIPTEVIERLYSVVDDSEGLTRLDNVCPQCGGSGETEHETENEVWEEECAACGGTGVAPESELYAYPAAHGTCWVVEDRDEVREAAIACGFIVYAADDGPFSGALILCVDGGGYSFYGQHWLPLRARMAEEQIRDDAELATFFDAWLDEEAQRQGETRASVRKRAGLR